MSPYVWFTGVVILCAVAVGVYYLLRKKPETEDDGVTPPPPPPQFKECVDDDELGMQCGDGSICACPDGTRCLDGQCLPEGVYFLANGDLGVCPVGFSPARPTTHDHPTSRDFFRAGAVLSNYCIGQKLNSPYPALPNIEFEWAHPTGPGDDMPKEWPIPSGPGHKPKTMMWDGGLRVAEPMSAQYWIDQYLLG